MDNLWLDGFLMDNGLYTLVDMMMNMLAFDSWGCRSGVSCLVSCAGVSEAGSLTFELLFGLTNVVMLELSLLNGAHVVSVLLWEDFLMLDGLDGGVIVVLMDLTVNSFLDFFMTSWLHMLLSDSGSDTAQKLGGELKLLLKDHLVCKTLFIPREGIG